MKASFNAPVWNIRSIGLATVMFAIPASAQEVLHRIEGIAIFDQFGRADEIGDLDGDGIPDMASVDGPDRVVFYSGADASLIDMTDSNFDYNTGATDVVGIGDFDGDGVPDVMAGAPGFNVVQGHGKVIILSGATADEIVSFVGTFDCHYLGLKIGEVGDVDGDGYADALFAGFTGPAQLRFGPDGSRVRIHATVGLNGAVAGIGDVNGDGYPDYGIGSPNFIVSGLANAGAMDIYSGRDGTLLRRIVGDVDRGHLGVAAAPAGDLNGDGMDDVLIGLAGTVDIVNPGFGVARVYSGLDASVLWEYSPPAMYPEAFGIGMAGGKDFTGDGVCDWVVGATSARTPAVDHTGAFYMFDGASGALLWKAYGEEEFFGRMGLHVFLADDMNGDGLAEIGYGDTSADANGFSASGVLTVIAGAPGSASTYCTSNLNSIGRRAKIAREGPIGLGINELTLQVSDAVPGSFGLFYYGTQAVQSPFGDGTRCVGGMTQRLFPPIPVDATGHVNRVLDFTQPPVAPGSTSPIDAGSTRYFQFWYRDATGPGGTGFNLSDAMEILFTP